MSPTEQIDNPAEQTDNPAEQTDNPATQIDYPEYPNLSVGLDVDKWKYNVAVYYQSLNPDEISKTQVTEIRWFKNLGSLEHEYLVATCHRDGEADVYLRLERQPANSEFLPKEMTETFTEGETDQHRANMAAEQKSINRSIWNNIQKSATLKGNLRSLDSVTRVDSPEGSSEAQVQLIAHYRHFRKPFCLRDLAFLAWAVNQFQPAYRLFVNQCYWYARTLVNVAKEIYEPDSAIRGDGFEAAGTYTIRVTNRTIDVSKDHQADVNRIQVIFQEAVVVHDNQVKEKYDKRSGEFHEYYEQRIRDLEARVLPMNSGVNSISMTPLGDSA